MSDVEHHDGISRRTLVKSAAMGSLALAAGGISLPFGLKSAAAAVQNAVQPAEDKVVWGACSVNCGSRCALRLHVRDDEVYWVETDNTGEDIYGNHQVRACLRGRSIRRRINHPDRLNYPMKRVGKRGEGKFERITWDEALDTLTRSLKNVVEKYGNEAVYINYSSGIVGGNITRSSPYASLVARLMNCYGGFLSHYGTYSTAQISCAMPYTYGSNDGNSTSDIENSKLVVMFGNNPAETRMSGGGITYYLEQARERSNARMIVIDPRYTDTAAGREDEWIPIRPGTDAALVAGIAWVLINENLVDQPFLDKYCVGYDEKTLPEGAPANGHYKAYILGQGDDNTAKTPEWASRITGIPADRIIKLAREIGSTKPAYICQGWGPQRQANGELTSRAIAMLPILTGNVGINGGNSGARESTYTITIERMPLPENPVKTQISCFSWTDAIARGPEMTALRDGVRGKDKLDVPIKFIWNYAGNTIINQHSDINKTHDILQDESQCETIVVIDNFMTSSAKYADILLPDLMTVEQEDIIPNDYAGNMGYLIFLQPVTAPKFERKPIYWIMSEVAKRLGPDIHQKFTEGRTQAQWLQYLYAKMREKDPQLPSYDLLKKWAFISAKIPMDTSWRIKNSAMIRMPIRSKPRQARLKFTPASWQRLPPPGSWKKMKPSARCRCTPQRLTAGMPRNVKPTRCSCLASTSRRAPTPATATWMCLKLPVVRRCGLIRLMRHNAVFKTAIWCACLTTAAKCALPRKSPRVSCRRQRDGPGGLARRQHERRSDRPRFMHQHVDHPSPVTAGERQPAAHQSGADREGVRSNR